MGWVTVGAYLLTSLISLRVAMAGLRPAKSAFKERMFWLFLCIVLLALALNKQLDLQSFLTAAGRCAARMNGWYDQRHIVQKQFILVLVVVAVSMSLLVARSMRATRARTGLAVLGLGVVTCFVLVRALSFHGVDALIGLRVYGIEMNWVLELFGLILIALGALLHPWRADAAKRRHD